MVGRLNGVAVSVKAVAPLMIAAHCCIHRETLVGKTTSAEVKTVKRSEWSNLSKGVHNSHACCVYAVSYSLCGVVYKICCQYNLNTSGYSHKKLTQSGFSGVFYQGQTKKKGGHLVILILMHH